MIMTEEIRRAKTATLEGQIYICNSLFAECGAFPQYDGIYKISEHELMEGEAAPEDITVSAEYYTYFFGEFTPLTAEDVENIIDEELNKYSIGDVINMTHNGVEWVEDVITVGVEDF